MNVTALVRGRLRDARRAPRRKLDSRAWIRMDNGFSVRPCTIADLSDTGVRLTVPNANLVAGRFTLMMSRDDRQGRTCRITWRRGSEIGAEFIGSR